MRYSLACALGFYAAVLPAPLGAQTDDFNTQLIKATFKLANAKSTAAAFLLYRPAQDPSRTGRFVLVTAAHVFEQMEGNEAVLFFRQKEEAGAYKKLPVNLPIRKDGKPLWTKHPAVDIAVMEIVPPEKAEVPRLPLEALATDDTLKKYALHPGDTLLCLGYPHRMEANEAGFPVLRGGAIGSFPLVPTARTRTFLLNYNSFEGDSGGPVYIAETNRFVGGRKQPLKTELILGLVLGQHFVNQETRTVYETRSVRYRLGLAIVIHASFIRETINRLPRKP